MATALLSPSAKQYFADDDGAPLAGGKVYTYAANTTTPQATYTNRAGTVPNTNPIILDARGECVIYLTPGVVYDYKIERADASQVWTREDVSADAGDADAVTFTQAGSGAVTRSTQDKLRERVTPDDFGAVGTGLVDDVAAIAAADAVGPFRLVAGKTYRVSSNLTITSDVEFEPGAILSVDSGVNVVLNGAVNAGVYQIFAGAGTVSGFPLNWTFYPEWWGAKPDGVTDSTTALQSTVSTALGREVYLSGTYLTSAAITINHAVLLRGKSKLDSGIRTNSLTANVIEINHGANILSSVEIRDLTIDSTVTKTAGFGIAQIAASGSAMYLACIENVYMTASMFSGVAITAVFHARLKDVIVNRVGSNGIGFYFKGVDASSRVANVFMDTCQVWSGVAGINTIGMLIESHCEGMSFRDCTFESPGLNYGVVINNSFGAPNPPKHLWFNSVICDTNSGHGFNIINAQTVRMTDCWSTSCAQDGIRISTAVDLEIKGHSSIGNGNYGLFAASPNVKQLRIFGGVFDANGQAASNTYSGIVIGSNVSDFTIKDADFYRFGTTKTHKYDIEVVGGTSNNYIIKNNHCMGYLTAGIQDSGSGLNKIVNENLF